MLVPQAFATFFARAVELFRDPAAKEEQKTQFRALLALLKAGGATLKVGGGVLSVNGQPVPGAALEPLLRRLELHGVEQLVIAQDPPAGQLFELLKTLADPAGHEHLHTRLRAAGVDRVIVRLAEAPPEAGRSPNLGTEGIVRGETLEEIASLHIPAPDAEAPASAAPQPEAEPLAADEAEDAIAQLKRNPRGPNVPQLLQTIGQEIGDAMRSRRPERAMQLLAAIVRCEQLVPDQSLHRQYAGTLKRMYARPVLEALAHLVTVPGYHEDAVTALQGAGAAGVQVLLDLLVAAPTVGERQAVFAALTEMKEGTDQVVHMLAHSQWFVVRNVAELVGELGLEEAVPALATQLDHEDERVRKAVALALAKIGSGGAAEPLRRALRDQSPEVRMQAALGVGGRKSGALAMPLVVAMEEEENEEVERELILALGRIGSADAVQALIKFAQPPGRLFGRRPTTLRVAAVEALRLAATPAAVGMLQGLAEDADKQVRVAAQEALKDLKR